MKNWIYLGLLSAVSLSLMGPAEARGGIGVIGDVIELVQNVANGTIPLPFVIGFLVLVGAIVVLGVFEARKNAKKAAEAETAPVDLTK